MRTHRDGEDGYVSKGDRLFTADPNVNDGNAGPDQAVRAEKESGCAEKCLTEP